MGTALLALGTSLLSNALTKDSDDTTNWQSVDTDDTDKVSLDTGYNGDDNNISTVLI